jgi:hypothetical protein
MTEKIKITPEGLKLMIAVSNAGYSDGLYGKEIYFTDGFKGDTQYLFQALGNMGAYARRNNLEKEVSIVVVANKILSEPHMGLYTSFVNQFELLFNQKNTPYLRLVFMTEENLISRIQNRADNFNDDDLKDFLKKYKASYPEKKEKKEKPVSQESKSLFD